METAREVERPSAGRPRSRRWGWLLLMLLIVLLVGAVGLARRPPNRKTYVSEPMSKDPHTHFILEYPDDWKDTGIPGPDGGYLVLRRVPPSGLADWWRQYIQHEDTNQWRQDQLVVVMKPLEEIGSIDAVEQQEAKYHVSCRRIRHPLGPALEITWADRPPVEQNYFVYIYPQDRLAHRNLVVQIASTGTPSPASQLQSALSVLLEHLRLVDGK